MDPTGVEMSLFSTAFWQPPWHAGAPVQEPDLAAIVLALQDEVRGLREEVEGLRTLPQRVRGLEAQSAVVPDGPASGENGSKGRVGTSPHCVISDAVLEDFLAEDGVLGGDAAFPREKPGGVDHQFDHQLRGDGAVDVVSNDQPREDGDGQIDGQYAPADETAAGSRWRTEELAQSYELQVRTCSV